jgi:hypothetical protein
MSDLDKETPTYYIVKFNNGEEIICSLTETNKNTVKLINPMKIHTYPKMSETGEVKEQVAFHRWLQPYTNETEFNIDKKNIITIVKCSDIMMTYYENFLYKKNDINISHKEVSMESNEENKHRREYVSVETDKDVH